MFTCNCNDKDNENYKTIVATVNSCSHELNVRFANACRY